MHEAPSGRYSVIVEYAISGKLSDGTDITSYKLLVADGEHKGKLAAWLTLKQGKPPAIVEVEQIEVVAPSGKMIVNYAHVPNL